MPAPTPSPDPWTFFLDWLTTVLVPSWGDLVGLMPYFLILFVIGPIVTLLLLAWAWHLLRRRRGHVRREVLQPVPAPRGADGLAAYPPNVPYCEEHALLYPPRARRCEIDKADLLVACPVDGTVRAADIRTCPSCGTTYVLGAGASALVVTGASGPPAGGAAVA
jgi:hypothetical protein